MTNARLETLAWVLIYGGLIAVVLGIVLWRGASPTLGAALAAVGTAVAAAGGLLVWLRARRDRA